MVWIRRKTACCLAWSMGGLGVGEALSGGGSISDLMSKKQENCKLRFPALAAAIVFPAYLIFLLADTL